MYSTTRTIGNPSSWDAPRNLIRKVEDVKWIDFWVICDEKYAYLFYTRDHNEVMARQTLLASLLEGFGEAKTVFQGVHEAVHIYRDHGRRRNVMLFEQREPDLSRRYSRVESGNLLGPWRLTDRTFARASHGELIRESSDERLQADFDHPRFLVPELPAGGNLLDYPELRWRLKLIQ